MSMEKNKNKNKNKMSVGQMLVFGLAKMLAVGTLVAGVGGTGLVLREAWGYFASGGSEVDILYGVVTLGGAVLILGATLAFSAALWFLRKIEESVTF